MTHCVVDYKGPLRIYVIVEYSKMLSEMMQYRPRFAQTFYSILQTEHGNL